VTDQSFGVGYRMSLTRAFDAPRALVFDCFTRAEHLARWWGPREFSAPVCEVDARAGGSILIHMKGPEPYGTNPIEGEFTEVSPPERLVMVLRGFQGEDSEWGIEHVSTLDFAEADDGGTELTLTTVVRKVSEALKPALQGMKEGWSQSLDKLDELLPEIE
jgi:uncharacterized protein YndB with AHSA1/START domain